MTSLRPPCESLCRRVQTVQVSPAVVAHRFALWSLCLDEHEHATRDQLLQHDRTLLAALPVLPVARLLLPVDGPTALHSFAYARGPHAWSAQELFDRDPLSSGHFVLSLLPPASSTSHATDESSSLPHQQTPEQLLEPPLGAIATRLLLSNALVNVWDFCVAPRRTCELHEHRYPYVFINRTSGSTRNLDAQLQSTGETMFTANEFRFVDVQPHAQRCIHAFENSGDTSLQQYVVEFKQ